MTMGKAKLKKKMHEHHEHHEHHKGSKEEYMNKGGEVRKKKHRGKHHEAKVEGHKSKARMDKFARGGEVVDGNKNVVKASKEKNDSGVSATAATKMTSRPGFAAGTADREDD